MSGLYTASKIVHAHLWRQLRADGVPVCSTWIDVADAGVTVDFTDLWIRCVREAATADALLCFTKPDEVLKGGFVEVGAALASGVPVLVVGGHESWSWMNHPLVTKCVSINGAIQRFKDKCLSFPGMTFEVTFGDAPPKHPESERLISEECDALKALLIEKNRAYGDSALKPARIFAKSSPEEQILVRIDDKLNRILKGSAGDEDVVKDLLGYFILLRVARRMRDSEPKQ